MRKKVKEIALLYGEMKVQQYLELNSEFKKDMIGWGGRRISAAILSISFSGVRTSSRGLSERYFGLL